MLSNAAQEPEVVDLAELLCAMGARIRGAGSATIVVEGVRALRPVGFTVIPDRIEAGTFLVGDTCRCSGGCLARDGTPTSSSTGEDELHRRG